MAYSDLGNYTADYVYTEGDLMTLQWQTNWTTISVLLWQSGNASFQYLPNGKAIPATQNLTWLVDVEGLFDLQTGNVFFLAVFDAGTQLQFESHYFNITAGEASSGSLATASSRLYATATGTANLTSSTRISGSVANTPASLYTPPVPTAFATAELTSSVPASTTAAPTGSTPTTSATASATSSSTAAGRVSGEYFALALGLLVAIAFGF
ncbi:hypothetical protein LTR85_003050 [Meristemomyces frigidus]|nr:hypothetical protein LTR85_003050 [Meristemomyces frigidus]